MPRKPWCEYESDPETQRRPSKSLVCCSGVNISLHSLVFWCSVRRRGGTGVCAGTVHRLTAEGPADSSGWAHCRKATSGQVSLILPLLWPNISILIGRIPQISFSDWEIWGSGKLGQNWRSVGFYSVRALEAMITPSLNLIWAFPTQKSETLSILISESIITTN